MGQQSHQHDPGRGPRDEQRHGRSDLRTSDGRRRVSVFDEPDWGLRASAPLTYPSSCAGHQAERWWETSSAPAGVRSASMVAGIRLPDTTRVAPFHVSGLVREGWGDFAAEDVAVWSRLLVVTGALAITAVAYRSQLADALSQLGQ
jgi:hypothetical protein